MGTRGAVGFIKDGVHKVTYNHSDSYPDGLGNQVIDYIHDHTIEEMNAHFNNIKLVDEDKLPSDEQIAACEKNDTINLDVSNQSKTDWYCLLRNVHGQLAEYGKLGFMIDSREFLFDGLFCEYAYIINLTTNELEFYSGFKKEIPHGRYGKDAPIHEVVKERLEGNGKQEYYVGLETTTSLELIKKETKEYVFTHAFPEEK